MKRMLLTTAIAGLLLAGSPAFAGPSPDRDWRGDRHGQRNGIEHLDHLHLTGRQRCSAAQVRAAVGHC